LAIFIFNGPITAHRSFLAPAETEIWGWAWSDRPVRSVEVSFDGGRN
jgi:hypothetical protein